MTGGLLTTVEAAAFLRKAKATLEKWRCKGGGPPYSKQGGSILYRLIDLESWVAAGMREHTGKRIGGDA
jgi:hypothetical protein